MSSSGEVKAGGAVVVVVAQDLGSSPGKAGSRDDYCPRRLEGRDLRLEGRHRVRLSWGRHPRGGRTVCKKVA